jgi:hypothetical protein
MEEFPGKYFVNQIACSQLLVLGGRRNGLVLAGACFGFSVAKVWSYDLD